jgi:hypothetical protein
MLQGAEKYRDLRYPDQPMIDHARLSTTDRRTPLKMNSKLVTASSSSSSLRQEEEQSVGAVVEHCLQKTLRL